MADKVEAPKGKVDRKQRRLEYWKKNKKQRTPKDDSSTPSKDDTESKGKKRKVSEGGGETPQKKKKKKVKKSAPKEEPTDKQVASVEEEKKVKGFTLFVGSLPADATKENIIEHFKKTGSVDDFRMLMKKDGTFKRCGFLECADNDSMQACLALDHTDFDKCRIKVEVAGAAVKKTKVKEEGDAKDKKRYILFIGNLAYDTTKQFVIDHFSKSASVKDFRMLTEKDGNFKGYGFLELNDSQSMNTCLKYNNTDLCFRRIRVELTSGGGGNNERRVSKIRNKNKRHLTQDRKKKKAQNITETNC